MSVTIGKLVADYNSATFEERQRTKDIEVVPRKMVEDIIESCDNYQKSLALKAEKLDRSQLNSVAKNNAKIEALMFVMHLASGLLGDFEKGEEA
jgi:hypothetical protein